MTAGTVTPYQPGQQTARDGFAQLLRAEWIKFRTVRGWGIGLVVALLVMLGLGLFGAAGSNGADGLVTMRLFHLSLVYLTVVFAAVAAGAFIR